MLSISMADNVIAYKKSKETLKKIRLPTLQLFGRELRCPEISL